MSIGLHPVVLFTLVPHLYVVAVLCAVVPRAWGGAGGGAFLDGAFTRKKFYLLMGWAPLTFALLGLLVSPRYVALMLVCGAAGVVGEVIVSVVWRMFFGEPIWTYSHGAMLSGVTSTLNFLPWAVGAFLFHAVVLLVPVGPSSAPSALVGLVALAAGVLVVWPPYLFWTRGRRRFRGAAYAIFCAPVAACALALALWSSWRHLPAMALFAVVGFAFEYGYGRAMSIFFRQSLWRYNRWRIDGGHASFVSLPLWALGGVYFTEIARALGL